MAKTPRLVPDPFAAFLKQITEDAKTATETPVRIETWDDGYMIRWAPDDPLCFLWQTEKQLRNLLNKIQAIFDEKYNG